VKYYAVADDPSELMHYGVKGMKWGQHIFGDKPRSPGFKKAVSKLRASMKNGIKAKQAKWKQNSEIRSANKEAKREYKEARLAQQAESRLGEVLAKQGQRAIRKEIRKENRAERREQRNMDRYMQKARHGTLKYKKLRDDQIQSIAERLNLENQARRLSGNETPHMLTRIRRSIGEGVVRGVGAAVATGIEENARARARYNANKKYGAKQARLDAEQKRIKDRQQLKADRKNAKYEAKAEQEREYYKMLADEGRLGNKKRSSELSGYNARKKQTERERKFNDEINSAIIRGYTNRVSNGNMEAANSYLDRMTSGDWRSQVLNSYGSSVRKKDDAFTPPPSRYETFRSNVRGLRYRKSGTVTQTQNMNDWINATDNGIPYGSRTNWWTHARRPRRYR